MCQGEGISICWGSILGKDAPEHQADPRGQRGQDQEHIGQGHIPKADVHTQEQGDHQARHKDGDEDLAENRGVDHGVDDGQDQQNDQDAPGIDPAKGVKAEGGDVGVFKEHEQSHQDQDNAEDVLKTLFLCHCRCLLAFFFRSAADHGRRFSNRVTVSTWVAKTL